MENINEFLTGVLGRIGIPVAESLYEGDEEEFITFNLADSRGHEFGDNDTLGVICYVQVHYVCPWDQDYSGRVRKIRKALFSAGFTYPELTDVSDRQARIRHQVLECAIENNYDLEEEEDE